jgi:ankyrin repeat protein
MQSEFVRSIRRGDADDVRRLLKQGASVNEKLRERHDHGSFLEGVTPLMIAAGAPKSTVEIVRILLDAGANIADVSDGGVTATWYASGGGTGCALTDKFMAELDSPDHPYLNWGGGDVDRLRVLLDAGGDPKETASNGRSCVSEACQIGDPERLACLIELGASVWPANQKSFRIPSIQETTIRLMTGTSFSFMPVPLFEAAKSGNLACVKLVVDVGFPVDFEFDKKTALDYASTAEITDYLLKAGLTTKPGTFGFDAIDNAFEEDNFEVAARLLDAVPEIDRMRVLQQKLMMNAGLKMNPAAVQMLIDRGADVTLPDADYGSALHTACWQGRETRVVETMVNLLLDHGADIELWNRHGETPLFEAVEGDWSSPTSVRVLVLRGANVNATNKDGQTPLMIAARTGALECLQILLSAGADQNMRDSSRHTALDYAKSNLGTWSSGIKLPLSTRILNKLLGVKLEIDQTNYVREAKEIIRLLESR